jgi:hypothetical protein
VAANIKMPVTPEPDKWVRSPNDQTMHRLDLPRRTDPRNTCRACCGHLMPADAGRTYYSAPLPGVAMCRDCRPLETHTPPPPMPQLPTFAQLRPTRQVYGP